MELTSEQAHWLGGGVAVAIALVLILAELAVIRGAWVRYLIPAALLAWGLRSITHPVGRGVTAGGHEGGQHVMIGIVVAIVAVIEAARAGNRLRSSGWALMLPAGLLVVGALFYFHGQHAAGVPMLVLAVQHRIIGVTLGVAAIARALAELWSVHARELRLAWLVAVLLFGFELLLYTEGGMALHPM